MSSSSYAKYVNMDITIDKISACPSFTVVSIMCTNEGSAVSAYLVM